jgi:hypothetical protein
MPGQNTGNAGTQYRGESLVHEQDFLSRFLSDNFVIKIGIITEVYAGGYIAQVTFGASGSSHALWTSLSNSGLTGSADVSIPSIGSRVVVWKPPAGPCIILGTLPFAMFNHGALFNIENTRVEYESLKHHEILTKDNQYEADFYNDDRPLDILPGEFGWINEYGNVIALLRGLVLLKGNNLSQVQLHTLDRLVRIVSGNFEHLAEQFEKKAYNDHGDLSVEEKFFTKTKELLGDDGAVKQEDDKYSLKEGIEQYHRIAKHVGFLGGLLHLYARGEKAEENKVDSSEAQVEENGEVTLRTTKGVTLANTDRIYHPTRKVVDGEEASYYNSKKKEYEKVEDFTPTEGCQTVQEKERNLWLSKKYSKRKYHEDEWEIEEHKSPSAEEKIKESAFRLRPDGSILIKDSLGSSIELVDGNIILSCKGNIFLRSGKTLVALAGENLSLRAKKEIETVVTDGSYKLKAQKDISLLAKDKGITIETESAGLDEEMATGIRLKTHKAAPIVLDSGDRILSWSKKGTVFTDDYGVFLDSPIFASNMEKGGKETKFLFSSAITAIKTPTFALNVDKNIMMKSRRIMSGSERFIISASSQGYIHGGPKGTHINHEHVRGRDKFKYMRDGSLGGKMAWNIEKKNSMVNFSLDNIQIPDIDDIIAQYKKETLDKIKFKFVAYEEENFEDDIFETEWQREESKSRWNLLSKDTFEDTAPFPGATYDKYMKYIPKVAIITGNEKPQPMGGKFEAASLEEYKI